MASAILAGGTSPLHAQNEANDQTISDVDPIQLVFDLKDENDLKAALVVNSVAEPRPTSINVAVPFGIEKPSANERAAFRTGSFDQWTLLTFAAGGSSWPQRLSFKPRLSVGSDPMAVQAETRKSVFLVAQGQLRYFTYRYPTGSALADYTKRVGEIVRSPDAIGIELPMGSREVAVSNGRLSIPDRLRREERVFGGSVPATGETLIQIAYQVPPTNAQKVIVTWGLKFVAMLLPLIGLAFLPAEKVRRPKWRKGFFIGGSALVVVILAAIAWAATKTGALLDAALDAALLFGGCLVAGIVLAVKVKDQSSATPAATPTPTA